MRSEITTIIAFILGRIEDKYNLETNLITNNNNNAEK